MQTRSRIACLSAAVLAVWSSGSLVHADSLLFNPGQSTTGGTEGSGNWDNGATNWYDATTSTGPVAFNSSTPDSATFGVGNATALTTINGTQFYNVFLNDNVTVQNLTFGIAGTTVGTTTTNGHYYNLVDQQDGGQTLTLAGNVIKTSTVGTPQIFLTNAMQLTGGNHTFVINDSPGDVPAELAIQNPIAGATASITLDNTFGGANYQQYGTLLFGVDNTYAGGTTLTSGRLITRSAAGLGTGTLVVANAGAFQIGLASGGGQLSTLDNDITISNPIQITRSDYSSTAAFNKYTDAINVANDNNGRQTVTFTGAIDVASTDARVAANTNNIVISSNIKSSTGTGVLTLDGDFAGFVTLTGDNSGVGSIGAAGGIKLIGGVELNVDNQAELGGPNSALTFSGSGTLHPINGFMSDFGTHVINATTFSGGIDIDAGQSFTINNLSGVSVGKRGTGTLNLNGTNVFTGTPFYDAGIVNVNGSTTFAAFRLRSPTVNINSGGTLTTTGSFTDIGSDSPDSATVIVNNGGKLALATNQDFNISDNAGTTGVLIVNSGGIVTAGGGSYLGKSAGGKGTVTLNGSASYTEGTAAANNPLRIGANNATATGFFTVGDSATATAALTVNGALEVGFTGGATGTLTLNGGTILANKTGGNSFDLGDNQASTTVGSKGTFNMNAGTMTVAGETWIGSNSGVSTGIFNMAGGNYTGKDWFVVGRNGSFGTLNMTGGTITRTGGGGDNYIGEGTQQNSAINLSGGSMVFNNGQFFVGNAGATKATLNVSGTGSFTVNNNYLAVGRNGTAVGILNLSGGSVTQTGTGGVATVIGSGNGASGTVTQTGGAYSGVITAIGESGTGTWTASAGTASMGTLNVGQTGAAANSGTLTIGGTAAVTAGVTTLGNTGASKATVNLNGGTLTVASIAGGTSTGAKTLNLNGGTLLASANSAAFMGGLTTANVQAGGAKISSNGHAVTIAQALVHDTTVGAPATDGGLTKSGVGSVTLTAANTYTGQTSVVAGTLVAGNTLAFGNSAVSVTNGGILQVQQKQPPTAISIASLAIDSSSKVDLTNGAIVVRSGSFSAINTLVANAYINGGNYDFGGNGITSSSAAAHSQTDGSTGIGVVSNDNLGYTTYRGVTGLSGTSNEVLASYTFNGDTDLDSDVDGDDFTDFLTGLNAPGHAGTWLTGDFDYNGVVNGDDFAAFLTGLNAYRGNPTLSLTSAQIQNLYGELVAGDLTFTQLTAQLPEPTTLVGIAGGLALLGRRRRPVAHC